MYLITLFNVIYLLYLICDEGYIKITWMWTENDVESWKNKR